MYGVKEPKIEAVKGYAAVTIALCTLDTGEVRGRTVAIRYQGKGHKAVLGESFMQHPQDVLGVSIPNVVGLGDGDPPAESTRPSDSTISSQIGRIP